jgi:uncharacterized LabA/DUF88 family protein
VPRFYLRKLRTELAANGGVDTEAGHTVALLEPAALPLRTAEAEPEIIPPTEPAMPHVEIPAPVEPAAEAPAAPRRRRTRTRVAEAEAEAAKAEETLAVEAVMTEDVATVTGVVPPAEAAQAPRELAGEAEAVTTPEEAAEDAAAETPAGRRRRRRRRRGAAGHREAETAEAEIAGVLPGEPALPPEPVEYGEEFVPEVPPSSHLSELVRSGGLILPERRQRRHRRGTAETRNGVPSAPPAGAESERIVHLPQPSEAGRGARQRMTPIEELIARQNVLFDQLLQRQTAMLRAMERMMTVIERSGGGVVGAPGSLVAPPRVAVFVDVPNIVYAADRIGRTVDWGKVLHYLTRDRQLIRATAYAPVSDDPYQRVESQRFVQPFYNLPYRILTKPMKRFGNGEIKANFDVELAIDVITMADRLDIVCLVSGDGDFRRMVELVQSRGVRVEVIAFGSSTAGELRAVCDQYIDFSDHLNEFCIVR